MGWIKIRMDPELLAWISENSESTTLRITCE